MIYDALAGDNNLSWLEIDVSHLLLEEKVASACTLRQLQGVAHVHIIRVAHSGLSCSTGKLVFITERLPKTTVFAHIVNSGPVSIATAQHWCAQVINAMCLLHSCKPPIIHRALNCSHLTTFGDPENAPVACKIGGFALPQPDKERTVASVAAFIAPEMYDESTRVTAKVDIYALGMCVLHMLTGQEPYAECKHAPEVYKRVLGGSAPDALAEITDPNAQSFVQTCLQDAERRPTAQELASHEFVAKVAQPPPRVALSGGRIKQCKGSKLQLCLVLSIKGKQKEIAFPFDTDTDTAEGIATEMVSDVPLLAEGGEFLCVAIKETILRCSH